MTRRRAWLAALSVALAAGLVALGLVAVHRLAFFRIRSIEVAGIRHLDERDLVAKLGIPPDADILVSLSQIEASAAALPGVRAAEAARRWPGTIQLTIREAPAVAIAVEGGRVLVIDDRAAMLPVDPARLTTALPLADRDTALAALLGRLQATDPQWYRVVDRASIDGAEVRLEAAGRVVHVVAAAGSEVFRQLAVVREQLTEDGVAWLEIDARFRGRMFVRKGAA